MGMIYVVNFKTYLEGTGTNALYLAQVIEQVSRETGATILACLQASDIFAAAHKVSIPLYAQHVDPAGFGSSTGHVLPEAVKQAGATGTLLNHSERQIPLEVLEKSIARAREAGLDVIACAATPEECVKVAKFSPDFIALEPHDLIGSGKAVSKERPEVLVKARELLKGGIPLLCGAGVSTKEDVLKAKELGCAGVLLASAFVKAKNPLAMLRELVV